MKADISGSRFELKDVGVGRKKKKKVKKELNISSDRDETKARDVSKNKKKKIQKEEEMGEAVMDAGEPGNQRKKRKEKEKKKKDGGFENQDGGKKKQEYKAAEETEVAVEAGALNDGEVKKKKKKKKKRVPDECGGETGSTELPDKPPKKKSKKNKVRDLNEEAVLPEEGGGGKGKKIKPEEASGGGDEIKKKRKKVREESETVTDEPMEPEPHAEAKKKKKRKRKVEKEEKETKSDSNGVNEEVETTKKKKKKKRRKKVVELENLREEPRNGAVKKQKGEKAAGVKVKMEEDGADEDGQNSVVFVSSKAGNLDEASIDLGRRLALQKDVDQESQPAGFGQWGTAHFHSSAQQTKFLRLMGGFKKGSQAVTRSPAHFNMALGKDAQQSLQKGLMGEFERAQSRHMDFQNKGAGLGFAQPPNKTFSIDVNNRNSIRFDD